MATHFLKNFHPFINDYGAQEINKTKPFYALSFLSR